MGEAVEDTISGLQVEEIQLLKDGNGIASLDDALEYVEEHGLDLVMIKKTDSDILDEQIAICKILNYEKFLYNQKKKQKKQENKSRQIREVRFKPNTAPNDMLVKARIVDRLLSKNNRIKIEIRYKGRERKYISGGIEKIKVFLQMIRCEYVIEKEPKIGGDKVSIVVAPLTKA